MQSDSLSSDTGRSRLPPPTGASQPPPPAALAQSARSESLDESALKPRGTPAGASTTKEEGSVDADGVPAPPGPLMPQGGRIKGLMPRIIHFSPSWFSITMGHGVICQLINNLPWRSTHNVFRAIGTAFLLTDILLFTVFFLMISTRYIVYPSIIMRTLSHEQHSLFLGTIPMGFVTIVNSIATMGYHEYGLGIQFALVASYLWWIALAVSTVLAFAVPYFEFTKHDHSMPGLTAALLLPVVPPITVAAGGGVISGYLAAGYPDYAFAIFIGGYLMLGLGISLACAIMVLYLQRLTLHGIPPKEVIVSVFLPLGPTGLSGFSALQLGVVSLDLIPRLVERDPEHLSHLAGVGPVFYGVGLLWALIFWAWGMWWLLVAVGAFISQRLKGNIDFNMGWWGLTFPLASLALSTLLIGKELNSLFFNVIGTAEVIGVVIFWARVFVPTVLGAMRGTLYQAPCLAGWLPPSK